MVDNKKIIKDKLAEVKDIMNFLSSEYGIHYNIDVCTLNSRRDQITSYFNFIGGNLNEISMGVMAENIHSMLADYLYINGLMDSGKVVVRCVYDKNLPFGLQNFLRNGYCYLVDSIDIVDGKTYYNIHGLKDFFKGNIPKGFKGLNMKRFIQLQSKTKAN